jgi:anti-anti-sigma regulatory factor
VEPDITDGKISIDGDTLRIVGRLTLDDVDAFSGALQNLLEAAGRELVLDLSRVGFVSSRHIGSIAAVIGRAEEEGRKVTVLANEKIAFLFSITGLDGLCEVRVAPQA